MAAGEDLNARAVYVTGSVYDYPMPASGDATGHAFISYVQEDSAPVDRIQPMLGVRLTRFNGIPVWRDTVGLWPGEYWRVKIRTP